MSAHFTLAPKLRQLVNGIPVVGHASFNRFVFTPKKVPGRDPGLKANMPGSGPFVKPPPPCPEHEEEGGVVELELPPPQLVSATAHNSVIAAARSGAKLQFHP